MRRYIVVAMGVVAALFYANFLFSIGAGVTRVISDLEEPGQPGATLLRVTDVACAVLTLAILPFARRALPAGLWRRIAVGTMVVFAAAATLAAIVPSACPDGTVCIGARAILDTRIHNGASIVSDTAAFVSMGAAWLALRGRRPVWLSRFAAGDLALGIASSIAFGYFHSTGQPPGALGITQRVHVLTIAVWIAALAVAGARTLADQPPARQAPGVDPPRPR